MEEIIIDIKELEEISISDDSEVIIIGGEPEDLTTELTEQDNLLTTQKISLEDVKRALQGKIGGSGGGSVEIEKHYLDGTDLNILLSNGQTLIVDISGYIDGEITLDTIEKIEQLIVSSLENKTIEEVEE